MTANEVFTALFWIVAVSYVAYIGWFITGIVRARLARQAPLSRRTRSPR
jgi:hypothetical protein